MVSPLGYLFQVRDITELYLPLEVDRFNYKAQRWTNSGDIFIHDLFDNGCFASIVKTSSSTQQSI